MDAPNFNENTSPLSQLAVRLRAHYQTPSEAFVSLDVGDRKKLVKVDELFVNLAIVEEESQRLQEKMELEREEVNIAMTEPRNPEHPSHLFRGSTKEEQLSLMNSARNTSHQDRRGVMHDSEDIYSTKVAIKPENLFANHVLANGKRVQPKDVLLLGRAGVGKTTLCRYLAFRWATGNLWSAVPSTSTSLPPVPNVSIHSPYYRPPPPPLAATGYKFIFYLRLKEVANHNKLKEETRIHIILYHCLWKQCNVTEAESEQLWKDLMSLEDTAASPAVAEAEAEEKEENEKKSETDGEIAESLLLQSKVKNTFELSSMLFILDGYDEVAEERHPACEALMQIRVNYSDHSRLHVLTTSRPHAKISKHVDLVLEDVGFLDEDIPNYIRKYFVEWNIAENASVQTRDVAFADKLKAWLLQRPNVHQICHVPINLELLCSIWSDQHESMLQDELVMSDLYKRMLSKLMRRYLSKKLTAEEYTTFIGQYTETTVYKHILTHPHCQNALVYLEELAYVGFKTRNLILSAALFAQLTVKHGEKFQQSIAHFLETGFLKAVGTTAFNANEVDSGAREYYFIHLSFQEYLTARHFARLIMSGKLTREEKQFIVLNKYNPRYLLVWTYVSGVLATWEELHDRTPAESNRLISRGLNRYFRTLLKSHRDLYGVYELELLVRCAEEAKWHNCSVSTDLLKYLGSWVMRMSHLKKDRDLNPLLRHLSQLFISCPLAMAKVQYRGKEGLFNFLTYESTVPTWLEGMIRYMKFIIDMIIKFTEQVTMCRWYDEGNFKEPMFDKGGCCYPFVEGGEATGKWFEECTNTIGAHCDSSQQTGPFWCCIMAAQGCFLFTKAFIVTIVGLIVGICITIFFVVFGSLVLSYVLFFFLLMLVMVGIFPFFLGIYLDDKYRKLAEVLGEFMTKFKFSDVQTVRKLVTLIETSDPNTCARIIKAFRRTNFSKPLIPLIDIMLYKLLLSDDVTVKMTAFCAYLKFQLNTDINTHYKLANFLKQDEDILLFNHALYQYFVERATVFLYLRASMEEDEVVSDQKQLVSRLFITKTYRDILHPHITAVLLLFINNRLRLAPLLFTQDPHMKTMIQTHFVLVLKYLFEHFHISTESVDVLLQHQQHTMRNSITKSTVYEKHYPLPVANGYAIRNTMCNDTVFNFGSSATDTDDFFDQPAPNTGNWNNNNNSIGYNNQNSLTAAVLRRTMPELLTELKNAKTSDDITTALQNISKMNEMSRSDRNLMVKTLLSHAYWWSLSRDFFLLVLPVFILYVVPTGLICAFKGYRSIIWPIFAGCAIFIEVVKHKIFGWNPENATEVYKQATHLRTVASIGFILFMVLLDWLINLIVLYYKENLGCCAYYTPQHKLERFIESLSYWQVEHIQKVYNILMEPNNFAAVLENYPATNCFNSTNSLKDLLRTSLSSHHTAIWTAGRWTAGRGGGLLTGEDLCWYDGRELREFRCYNARKLKRDIASIRPLSSAVHIVKERFTCCTRTNNSNNNISSTIEVKISDGGEYLLDNGDVNVAAKAGVSRKLAANWTECNEQFTVFCHQHLSQTSVLSANRGRTADQLEAQQETRKNLTEKLINEDID